MPRGHTTGRRDAQRVFLLSPANSGGERMALVLSPAARFPLARAVQGTGAPLGEVFRFTSGLYFRGKLAYAEAFARPPRGVPGALVIAPGAGLAPPDVIVRSAHLRAFAAVPVDADDRRFREPLERDARLLAERLGRSGEVVLLGSIATRKYVEPLLAVLGERLLFPVEFVGRGDMSRGGLMLRAARAGMELAYAPVMGAVRHGPRPPRLPRLRRAAALTTIEATATATDTTTGTITIARMTTTATSIPTSSSTSKTTGPPPLSPAPAGERASVRGPTPTTTATTTGASPLSPAPAGERARVRGRTPTTTATTSTTTSKASTTSASTTGRARRRARRPSRG